VSAGAVLVTGGAGYVGSHAARALAAAGRRVVVLDDLSAGREAFVRWGPFVRGDVADEALVERSCRAHGVSGCLHLAGRISVEESVRDPAGYFRANVAATEALARALGRAGVRRLVFSSSAAVYGDPERVPIPEDHPRRPVSPYGESKARAEDALASSGLDVVSLRYFNAAGAARGAGIGEAHDPETHLVPLALAAAEGGRPLVVFGEDWPTPDGTCLRDYVHVEDLADAHVLALARLERGLGGGTWNLGAGEGRSVREVLAAAGRAAGREVPARSGPRRAGDPAVLVADVARARRDLGWAPARSSLERIVADAWAFRTSSASAASAAPRGTR
jgi:UDP-glucose-4-epimerase GalE